MGIMNTNLKNHTNTIYYNNNNNIEYNDNNLLEGYIHFDLDMPSRWNELLSNKDDRTIYFCDAPCGAGKTHSLINLISNLNIRESYLIIIDTVELGKEILLKLYQNDINDFQFFNNEDRKTYKTKSVKQETINYLYGCKENNKSVRLIMTRQMFNIIDLKSYTDTSKINLIKDELLLPIKNHSLCVPYTHSLFTDLLNVKEYDNELYQIKIKDDDSIEQVETIVNRYFDSINNQYKPLLSSLLNNNLVCIRKKEYQKIVIDYEIDSDKGINHAELSQYGNAKNTLNFIDFTSPDKFLGYKSTTILGANFKSSMLNHVWAKYHGITFKDNTVLSEQLRFTKHQLKCNLYITYLNKDNRWSISQANKEEKNGKTLLENNIDKVVSFTNELLKNDASHKGIISQCNIEHEELFNDDFFTMLPVMSQGLNKYQEYRIAYSSVSQNFSGQTLGILQNNFGIDADMISESMTKDTLYQFIMRTALRNPENTKDVHLIVSNKLLSEFLSLLFDGAIFIKHIDDKEYKKVYIQNTSKNQYHKTKSDILNDLLNRNNNDSNTANNNETFSIAKSIYDKNITHTISMSNKDFFSFLKQYSKNNIVESKTDNRAIINAVFNQDENKQRRRKKDNINYSKTFMLDIDEGDMNMTSCFMILKRYVDYSCLIYDTWSNNPKEDNRYRVAFTLDSKVNRDEYKLIAQYFIKLFEKHHYYTVSNDIKHDEKKFEKWFNDIKQKDPKAKLSGIDTSKLTPGSLFFLPVSNKDKKCKVKTLRLNEDSIIDINVKDIIEQSDIKVANSKVKPKIVYQTIIKNNNDNNFSSNDDKTKKGKIKLFEKVSSDIDNILSTMCAGNRHHPAFKIATKVKYLKDKIDYSDWLEYQALIHQELLFKGCDSNTMKNTYELISNQ